MLTEGPPFRIQFYSWYIYPEREEDLGKSVSSAAYIEDVNQVRFCNTFDVLIHVTDDTFVRHRTLL